MPSDVFPVEAAQDKILIIGVKIEFLLTILITVSCPAWKAPVRTSLVLLKSVKELRTWPCSKLQNENQKQKIFLPFSVTESSWPPSTLPCSPLQMCKWRERRNGAVCIFTAHQKIQTMSLSSQVCSSLATLLLFLIQLNSKMCFSQIFQIKESVSIWAILTALTFIGFSGCRRGRRGGNGALAGSSRGLHLPCLFNLENCSSLRDSSMAFM